MCSGRTKTGPSHFGFRSLVFRYFPVSHVCSSNMDDENDKLEEDFYQFLNLARDVSLYFVVVNQ